MTDIRRETSEEGLQDTPEARRAAAAERARAEAEARRAAYAAREKELTAAKEIDGRKGPEPVRYGDWERKGLATDF